MSQFDFPRFNFSGAAFIDPGTANNNYFSPLVIYDAINCRTYLPPRIYIDKRFFVEQENAEEIILQLRKQHNVLSDDAGKEYIELAAINSKETFLDWCMTPLGSHELDKMFHALYEQLIVPKSQKKLSNECPAYWNFFGKMTFGFNDVAITSVETYDRQKGKILHKNKASSPFSEILGAEFSMMDRFNLPYGVMIDVCPTMSVYSQTFCDLMTLKTGNQSWFSGKPCKGSLRLMNPFRIVNQHSICGASGTFFSAIAIEDLEDGEQNPFIKLLRTHADSSRNLRGIFIRYNMFEVVEDRNPDYATLGNNSNPARCTITGSLAPWYEGDMKSFTASRQLNGASSFLGHRRMSPLLCSVDESRKLIALDLVGNIPETNKAVTNPFEDPTFYPQTYETYSLGELTLSLQMPNDDEIDVGKFTIDNKQFDRARHLLEGTIFEFSFPAELTAEHLEHGLFIIRGLSRKDENDPGEMTILSKESEYVITTDEAGLYANEGDDPAQGYISYGYPKEPCRIRIFSRGKPVKSPVELGILEYKVTDSGETFKPIELPGGNALSDNQIIELPIDKPCNAVYIFSAEKGIPRLDNIYRELVKTGYFISLRVLPNKRLEKYFDPNHPEYAEKVSFDLLYKEVFELYDLIYPVSGHISPFDEDSFIKGKPYITRLMDDRNWASPSYMPSTRELSDNQKRLYRKWAQQTD